MAPLARKVRVFCSYTHKDEPLLRQLDVHLAALRRTGIIDVWHDRKLVPGTDWRTNLDAELGAADIILLLVSADFINSDFCMSIEMKRALERFEQREALVIPIAMRPCDWMGTSLDGLQALPQDRRPVTTWSNRDVAMLNVAKGIRRAIEALSTLPRGPDGTSAPAVREEAVQASKAGLDQILSRVFTRANTASVAWMRTALERTKAIALLRTRDGSSRATGFVLDGNAIGLGESGERVLLVPDSGGYATGEVGGKEPHHLEAYFEIQGFSRDLGRQLWRSEALHAAIFSLRNSAELPVLPIGFWGSDADESSRLFVVGHPGGGPLSFSLWDGQWLDRSEDFLQYRAATSPGSGGSPVFNESWQVVAMHMSASKRLPRFNSTETYAACQGPLLQAIHARIKESR